MQPTDDPRQPVDIRAPDVHDAASMWRIARDARLDLNSPYSYLLLCDDFAQTCLVAEDDRGLVGFVTGYRPPTRPEVVFVWQVAVDERARRRGLGVALVDELVRRSRRAGVQHLEATVTPSNDASLRLFESVAERHGAAFTKASRFGTDLFPGGDHDEELSIRVGPFAADARAPDPHA